MDVKTELKDKKFIYRAIVGEKEKKLIFDYDKCCGCSICVDLCPNSAISLGPIFEIATGMDAPPILIDEHKCSFCGMCAAFCPYNAIKMEDISEDYPHLQSSIEVDDSKCLPCKLCERVCDSDAIKVTFDMPKKEDLVLYRKLARGEIIVDRDKCNFCGICAEFCDAFFLLERTPTPLDLRPYEDLLIDEDKCDYCGLCVDLCPEEAIKVISMAKVAIRIRLKGEIEIDEEKCTKCGKCQEICPYDAIKVEKPMKGAIKLIKNHLGRCDPIGCHACINICPNKAWYVSPDKEEKVGVNEDYCIYCGACEEACWVNAIDVRRDEVKHTEIQKRYPWSKSWEDGIEAIKGKERERPDLSRIVTAEKVEEEKKIVEEEELPVIDEKSVDKAVKSIEDVMSTLNNKKVRFFWEKGDERTKDEVLKRIRKKT